MKIGMFDSGIGGLCVLSKALKMLPCAEFVYYADTDNVPYGEKNPLQIVQYAKSATDFLCAKGAFAIVIACNTATSMAVAKLREIYESENCKYGYIPIIGMEPAIKPAVECFESGRILASATPVTVKGKKLFDLMEKYDKDKRVDLLPLPMLVRFAENGDFDSDKVHNYIENSLSKYDLGEYSAFVLGCTHFNFFKKALATHLPPHIKFVDGIDGTISRLLYRLETQCNISAQSVKEDSPLTKADFERVTFYKSMKAVSNEEKMQFEELIKTASEAEKI